MSAFGDFIRSIGRVFKPAEGVREWRQQKRQFKAMLQAEGLDSSTVRARLRQWIQDHPKPRESAEERQKRYGEIPTLIDTGVDIFTGNGSGQTSKTPTGGLPPILDRGTGIAGINPLFLLVLIPIAFPKYFKNIF